MNPIFSANWIKAKRNNKMAATNFWRSFTPKKDLVSGKLIITAHGVFTAYLNGQRVGEDILSPGDAKAYILNVTKDYFGI